MLSRIASAPVQSPCAQRKPSTACEAHVEAGEVFSASSAIMAAATGSSARCASMNRPRRPSSRVSSRSAMARKARVRALAVAVELGGLRMQQQCQRIVRGMAAGDIGMGAGGGGIAVADREQSLGDRVTAARLAPLAPVFADPSRHAPEPAQHAHVSIAATTTTPSASTNTAGVVYRASRPMTARHRRSARRPRPHPPPRARSTPETE